MKAIRNLGLLMILFGIGCGDSPALIVPVMIITVGGVLFTEGERAE